MLEFPDIRSLSSIQSQRYALTDVGEVDYFRKVPDRTPPLACFLSHVHSDHLQGLKSLRCPFVYCSAGTREVSNPILLAFLALIECSKAIATSRKVSSSDEL